MTAHIMDIKFLSHISIFSSLPKADLEELTTLWKPVNIKEGQVLFQKGDPGTSMFIIRKGEIAISVWTEDNQQTVLTVFGEGDFFGELSLFKSSPRSASAKAVRDALLFEMTHDDFYSFLQKRPGVSLIMTEVIADRLRSTNEKMERMTTKNLNVEIEQHLGFADRLAGTIAKGVGSWNFIIFFVFVLILWVGINTIALFASPLDPFPYTFLNFILSCLAAIQAPIIIMSQNRQAAKDRVSAELDFQVNKKAEMQIQSLHVKIDELRSSEIRELCQLQKEYIALLKSQIKE